MYSKCKYVSLASPLTLSPHLHHQIMCSELLGGVCVHACACVRVCVCVCVCVTILERSQPDLLGI